MSPASQFYLIGLNHVTAPLPVRERFAGDFESLRPRLEALAAECRELVYLGTCNRSEWYLHGTAAQASAALAGIRAMGDLDDSAFARHFYVHEGRRALGHLCRVLAGLDSMVLGETQIMGQVRTALRLALDHGLAGNRLNAIFQHALHLGRQVRQQSRLGEGALSWGSLATRLARQAFADLPRRRLLLVGAGAMNRLVAQHFHKAGLRAPLVLNRHADRAQVLAREFGGEGATLGILAESLDWADVVVSSTASPECMISEDMMRAAMIRREQRPILLIDLAMPRDVAPAVGRIPGVRLHDLDHLTLLAGNGRRERAAEAPAAEALLERLLQEPTPLDAQEIAPVVSDLRQRVETLRERELSRLFQRHQQWSPEERHAIGYAMDHVLRQVLHPTLAALHDPHLRQEGSLPLFRRLFALPTAAPEAIP